MYVMALVFITELIGDNKVRFVLQSIKTDLHNALKRNTVPFGYIIKINTLHVKRTEEYEI